MTKPTIDAAYLRPAQAARYIGVSTRTIRQWQAKRLVRFSAIGHRCILFAKTDLDAFIQQNLA